MTLVNSSARTRPRDVAAAVTLWLPFLAVVATGVLWLDRLPGVLPRQWGRDGAVSSTMPTWAMAVIALVVSLGAALLATYWLRERGAPNRRQVYLGLGFAAGLSSCLWLTTAGITVAAGAAEPAIGAWVLLTFVACGYGLIPFFIAQKWVVTATMTEPGSLAEPTVTGPDTAWSRLVTSPVMALIGGIIGVGGVVAIVFQLREDGPESAVAAGVMAGVIVVLILLVTLVFVQVRVSVDQRGLRVVSRLLGIRLKRVRLDQVESAFTDIVSPLRSGGWGYRLTGGRTAVVMRGGPALVVNLRRGNQFAVTVDDPQTAADLLTALSALHPTAR